MKTKLNENRMEQVSGGYVYENEQQYHTDWQVIDDYTGDVIATFDDPSRATSYCLEHGIERYTISTSELNDLRARSRHHSGGQSGTW